jgi:hypothetical protein
MSVSSLPGPSGSLPPWPLPTEASTAAATSEGDVERGGGPLAAGGTPSAAHCLGERLVLLPALGPVPEPRHGRSAHPAQLAPVPAVSMVFELLPLWAYGLTACRFVLLFCLNLVLLPSLLLC